MQLRVNRANHKSRTADWPTGRTTNHPAVVALLLLMTTTLLYTYRIVGNYTDTAVYYYTVAWRPGVSRGERAPANPICCLFRFAIFYSVPTVRAAAVIVSLIFRRSDTTHGRVWHFFFFFTISVLKPSRFVVHRHKCVHVYVFRKKKNNTKQNKYK